MSARRLPVGLLVMLPVLLGFGVYAFTAQAQVPDPNATATATGIAPNATPVAPMTSAPDELGTWYATTPPPAPTHTATPTSTPGAQVQRGSLREGAWVRVNAGEGDCLNARNTPSLDAEWVIVNTCLPHGFEGYIAGSAEHRDGHWWWFLAGAGWVAEEYLQQVSYVDLRALIRPELAGRGQIAFIRDDGTFSRGEIWVMNADGSEQRLLRRVGDAGYPQGLTWSPDGRLLAFSTSTQRTHEDGNMVWDVQVISVANGAIVAVIENAYGAGWSPDGTRVSTVSEARVEGMSGLKGIPAVVDVATGARTSFGSSPSWQQIVPSFNHNGSKLLVTYADYENEADQGPRIMVWDLAGNELARIVAPAETYYASPVWSPVADRIMFHVGSAGQPQYVVYDLERHDIVGGARVPRASDKIGGKCGSWDMWAATWSRDGRSVLYSFTMGDTGANGIWVWNSETGDQVLVPALYASDASAGPDGYLTFSSSGGASGHIFVGSSSGGFPTLITDGREPVWSP